MPEPTTDNSVMTDFVQACHERINDAQLLETQGKVIRVAGLVMEAVGLKLPVGSPCYVPLPNNSRVDAEVVGFDGDRLFLMPLGNVEGVKPGAYVIPSDSIPRPLSFDHETSHEQSTPSSGRSLPVGFQLLGRVIDAAGKALDSGPAIESYPSAPLYVPPINPLRRSPIVEKLDTGIRAINAGLPVGRGQRMGLIAGSGVGKSILIGMMTRYTTADITVVALIGERGREVKEFVDDILGEEGLARSVIVAAPADNSAIMRLQGAFYATAIAEYFRDQGKNVLLIMDSLTRYAMAAREIGLAIGEPPATKGYPPSVFAKIPTLIERAGNGESGSGSITAFYTILTEGEESQDPVADSAKAILDGHIILNRQLADSGHYPAIDIEQSISRSMTTISSAEHQKEARQLKALISKYQRNRDLINVGAYVAGNDPILDLAIEKYPAIEQFLQQGIDEKHGIEESLRELSALFA
jgi:flagellum-specific ATP synthase